jgi:glucose dehydrogenase
MINAVIYDTSTGKVVSKLTVPDLDCLALNIQDSQDYIISDWSGDLSLATVVDGEVVEGSPTNQTESIARGMRDSLLSSSDWTQIPDSPLTETKKAEWQVYRQELRDLFNDFTYTNIEDVVWPTQPS